MAVPYVNPHSGFRRGTRIAGPLVNDLRRQNENRADISGLSLSVEPEQVIDWSDFTRSQDFLAADWSISEVGIGSQALSPSEPNGALVVTSGASSSNSESLQRNWASWRAQVEDAALWYRSRLKVDASPSTIDLFAGMAVPGTLPPGTPAAFTPARSYGILGASAVTNTGSSVIAGNLGLYPGTSVTGFPPGTISGQENIANPAAQQAQAAALSTYTSLQAMTPTTIAAALDGQTLTPGVYKSAGGTFTLAQSAGGTLTLNGSGIYVFQTSSTLTTGAGGIPVIALTGGAQANQVYWVVGSSATINSGSAGTFQGNIIAQASITDTLGGTVNGTLAALTGAVTLSAASNVNSQPLNVSSPLTAAGRINFRVTSGSPVIFAECNDGSTTKSVATPYSIAANTYVELSWRATTGSVVFYVNNSQAAVISLNLPASSLALTPTYHIATNSAAARVLTIDSMLAAQERN